MELRQIRSFLSIAQTLHFRRTAELIHLSQPALSLQIRTLEEEVGVRLFERNRRKTTLTAAGFAFAMMPLQRSRNWTKRFAGRSWLLMGNWDYCGSASSQLPEALDFCVCRLAGTRPSILSHCIAKPFVLVVPASHKLAKRKRVRLSEVSGQDFVMYERAYAPGFHDLIFGMFRDAKIVPAVSQTAAEISTLISLVDAHMGIAIVPLSAVKHSVTSVIACDIVDQIPMSEIAIVVSKRVRAAVVDNFRSFALEKLGRARSYANRS